MLMSYPQIGLWLSERIQPGNPVYNVGEAWRLEGDLQVDRLNQALLSVVQRHQPLHTCFREVNGLPQWGQPAQASHPPLRVMPMTNWPQALKNAQEWVREAFDLQSGPLIRAWLQPIDSQLHLLFISLHHIAVDGWSMGILTRELGAFYSGQSLDPLPLQYSDCARSRLDLVQSQPGAAQLSYWIEQLSGAATPLELPLDHPRPQQTTHQGARHYFEISDELKRDLSALAQGHRASLFMCLQAALSAWLYRLTGQADIPIGVPYADRANLEEEQLIGMFVNILVLRTKVAAGESFSGFLGRCRDTVLDAFDHKELPFEKLVECLNPPRSLNSSPLFQVLLAFQNHARPPLELAGLRIEPVPLDPQTAKYDLSLFCEPGPNGLACFFEYDTDLFQPATVAAWTQSFLAFLTGLVQNPAQTVELAVEIADQAQPLPAGCLHEWFLATASTFPSRVALRGPDRVLTYATLQNEVLALAAGLQTRGFGAGSLVGLHIQPGIDQVVALLGVLCAGAAFVPLDSEANGRLDWVRENFPLLIVLAAPDRRLPGIPSFTLEEVSLFPSLYRSPDLALEELAYVMFTSGSTGVPKAVEGTQRATINRLIWMSEEFPYGAHEVACQKTSLHFIDSLAEILGPILAGVPLVVTEQWQREPETLLRILQQERVTRLLVVPSLWKAVLQLEGALPALEMVVSSGEALRPELIRQHRSQLPGCLLLNLYGTTELAGDVTFHVVQGEVASLGRAIYNTRLHVLDEQLHPVPMGSKGMLYVAGFSLARGYLGDAAANQAAFLPNPFSSQPGARMYRTGDLVRQTPDGNLEFCGRSDHQLKVRGVRVEPGEIESNLERHPGVQEAAVRLLGDQLVAYWVACGPATVHELRVWLLACLPAILIPTRWIAVAALPRTPTGKLDRRRLPEPEFLASPDLRPADACESKLAELWSEVLGVRPNPGDDFFALGGYSLLALSLLLRIEKSFGVRLPLASLFSAPRLEAQAALLREHNPPESSLVCLQPLGSGPPLVLVHAIGGGVLVYRELVEQLALDRPVYALQARGLFGSADSNLESMARFYLKELLQIQPRGPYLLAGLSAGGVIAFEMARQLHQACGEQASVLLLDSYAPGRKRDSFTGFRNQGCHTVQRVLFHLEALRAVGLERWQAYLLPRLKRRLRPAEVLPEVVRTTAQTSLALTGYRGGAYPGRVHLFRVRYQPPGSDPDLTNGWSRFCTDLRVTTVPGLHGEIMVQSPYCLDALCHAIKSAVES